MTGPHAPAGGDPYQERYLAHQARKRDTLLAIMRARHSDRMYDARPVPPQVRERVLEVVELCPSSCDRRGVSVRQVDGRDELALLGGLLVGGVGWVHRAPWVLLLMADPLAYKAGDEVEFMPYLDAGVIVQQLLLRAADVGLAAAFVNPNIRERDRPHFTAVFGEGIYCGAVALGWPVPGSPDRLRNQRRLAELAAARAADEAASMAGELATRRPAPDPERRREG